MTEKLLYRQRITKDISIDIEKMVSLLEEDGYTLDEAIYESSDDNVTEDDIDKLDKNAILHALGWYWVNNKG